MPVKPVPDGYHAITPYLIVEDIPAVIRFLEQAFGAKVSEKVELPDGAIMHAEVRIGDSPVMMGGARPGHPAMPAALYLYVEDADAVYRRAVAAGGVSIMEPADMFYGDRNAGVKDPCGNQWWIGTRKENVPHDELVRRVKEMFAGGRGD
jgi:PhnB protein